MHVLLAGLSARAAAESAARAGFTVTTIDAFADRDQHPSVRAVTLPRDPDARFSPQTAVRSAHGIECDAVAYLANFENDPAAVDGLAAGRRLLGNAPDVLRRVRNPLWLSRALARRGFPVPAVSLNGPNGPNAPNGPNDPNEQSWLLKPLASGGGRGVRPWTRRRRVPAGHYVQERLEGTPGSVVFVAADGGAVPVGISRQLIGDAAFGAAGYHYCGSILAAAGDPQSPDEARLVERASALAGAVVEAFGLVGLNGIDFMARDGVPHAVEVNPRWCSSMELVERAHGLSMFGAHAAACLSGMLPRFDLRDARRGGTVGKAIVFARHAVAIGDTDPWLADSTVRDVPHPAERIAEGGPVCTIFAEARDSADCYASLVRRAERIYEDLATWERGAA